MSGLTLSLAVLVLFAGCQLNDIPPSPTGTGSPDVSASPVAPHVDLSHPSETPVETADPVAPHVELSPQPEPTFTID